ncbi:MAG: ribonuclease domain-containing protein [Eubacteriales bacterium]|nr:ribonuclease domain-containing protein [Eubacteriales bacterium]
MYKKRSMLSTVVVLIAAAALWWFTGGGGPVGDAPKGDGPAIVEDGTYTTKEDVAAYLHTYGELPGNFITKDEARALGWQGGGLIDIAPDSAIGGDRFGNYEELLPIEAGRIYYECDIDTLNAVSRGAKRIVYSNDGLIFYTDDHYESFTRLYGEATP